MQSAWRILVSSMGSQEGVTVTLGAREAATPSGEGEVEGQEVHMTRSVLLLSYM